MFNSHDDHDNLIENELWITYVSGNLKLATGKRTKFFSVADSERHLSNVFQMETSYHWKIS